MKLIKPSFEILNQGPGLEGIYKQIEKAARTCYKSESQITEDSAKKFVDMLIARGHTAMLEHGTVYLKIPFSPSVNKYSENPYSKIFVYYMEPTCYITTNYRVLLENDWLDDLKYLCEPTEYHEKRVTVKLITSIGIGRELLRHRVFSFSNESTRWINYYSKGGELTFIHSDWYTDEAGNTTAVIDNDQKWLYQNIEACYRYLVTVLNKKPEVARNVLPLSTKSELVMTGYISDWQKVFRERVDGISGRPHPDMIDLIEPVQEEFIKRNLIL